MRVLFDGVAFQNGHQRGVQRGFRALIDHLPETVRVDLWLTEDAKAELPTRAGVHRLGMPFSRLLPRKARRRVQPKLARRRIRDLAAGADVFHSTYFTPPPVDMPTVLTVHDLILERYCDYFSDKSLGAVFEERRKLVASASRVIAVSEATAMELERFYPGASAKTRVVHWGAEHVSKPVGPVADGDRGVGGGDERSLLVVGDRSAYKNFRLVLDALDLGAWPEGLGVTVVGPTWSASERFRVDVLASRGRRIVHRGRVTDDELGRLYRGAAGVVVPSLCEGFGFPIVEAQSAGAVVVCSETAVFREVAGDGAVYFDPFDAGDLVRALGSLDDPGVRSRVVEAGFRSLERLSWPGCAGRTLAVYEEAAGA